MAAAVAHGIRRGQPWAGLSVAGSVANLDTIVEVTRRVWRASSRLMLVQGFLDLAATTREEVRKGGNDGSDVAATLHGTQLWSLRSNRSLAADKILGRAVQQKCGAIMAR